MRGVLFLICVILLSTSALGFGVSPAASTLTAPQEETLVLRILNSERVDFEVDITLEDDYGFLTSERQTIQLSANQREASVVFRVRTPQTILPGVYAPSILFEKRPPPGEQLVIATQAIRHRVQIIIPQDGVFLNITPLIGVGAAGERMPVGVLARNVGTEDVQELSATLTIVDKQGNTLFEHATDTYRVASTQQRRLETLWTPPEQGVYELLASVHYESQTTQLREEFTVGTLALQLGALGTGPYSYGDILRLDIPVASDWNQQLRNVYAEIELSRDGRVVDAIITPTVHIPALGSATLQGFWNTQGVEFGVYDIRVRAHYSGKTTERTYQLIIGADGLGVPREGIPVYARVLVLVLLLVIAGMILYSRARQKD